MSELIWCSLNKLHKDPYTNDNELYKRFSKDESEKAARFHVSIPGYFQTPLRNLACLSKHLGVSRIWVKDESFRFGLNAYKYLGVTYAVAKSLLGEEIRDMTWKDVEDKIKNLDKKPLFVTATDGNHGYGLAFVAQQLGCQAHIYMPEDTAISRVKRTEKLGAKVQVLDKNYDDTVFVALADAKENDGLFIQDTTLENYIDIPLHIMQGYMTLMTECWLQADFDQADNFPTHIFLQVGVGSFSGGMTGFLMDKIRSKRNPPPKIIYVEPRGAHCVYRSHQIGDGDLHVMSGSLSTVMAGLNCGTPSGLGWPILRDNAFAFLSCEDEVTLRGMRALYYPIEGDAQIVSGESGAVTLGALHLLCTDAKYAHVKQQLGIDGTSRVLLISTEGDTDPDGFKRTIAAGKIP